MIYIKTRMKKIPETCKTCSYKQIIGGWGDQDGCYTALGDNRVLPDFIFDKERNN